MPGDPLKDVLEGQPLHIPAEAYNAWNAAARAHLARKHNISVESERSIRQPEIVRVKNMTDDGLPRFSVLALGDPIIDSEENLLEFQNKVNFEGNKPEEPVRGQRFAVMLDPVAREAIGRGVIAGAMPVRINVIRQEDTFAELVLDETECLRSCPHGLTRILWKEEGLGVKWAVVRLGDRPRFAIFELAGVWIPSEHPEPDGWAKMNGCRPVFYFHDERTYSVDSREPLETIWHATGYLPAEREAVIQLHKDTGRFPAKFGGGDWVWCVWHEQDCRWQVLQSYEDHWRFVLLTGLNRCGSALAQLVLFHHGRWCPVDLTFTVHDAIGVVCSGLCKATGSSSGACSCGDGAAVPAGTYGIARRFADSCKWEVLALGRGCCPGSSSSMSSSGSSSASSSSSWSSFSSGSSSGDSSSSSSISSPGSSSSSLAPSSSGGSSGSGSSSTPSSWRSCRRSPRCRTGGSSACCGASCSGTPGRNGHSHQPLRPLRSLELGSCLSPSRLAAGRE